MSGADGLRVFVTQELFPFNAGGIGRVIASFLEESTPEELRRTAIVYLSEDDSLGARFAAVYPGVILCQVAQDELIEENGRQYPPSSAYDSTHPLQARSVLVAHALSRLEREHGALGYVEFCDWGAVALAACQQKKLGRAFVGATLAVRLHTTDSVLASFEERYTDASSLGLYDLERKALADCDLIVGQLEPVAESVRKFYGFDVADWRARLRLHAPPVRIHGAKAARSLRPSASTPIAFTSKIQHCKRPDVFVRGCVEFFASRPDIQAPVQFIAHAFDPAYRERIEQLIPRELRHRFQFITGLSGAAREAAIARAVCVFTTAYESFCLAAYEASLQGALCLVNTRNPAFGEGTPWIDGHNCIGFDGSAEGLAAALEAAYGRQQELDVVQVPADRAPWTTGANAAAQPPSRAHAARVTAVVINHHGLTGLVDTLEALSASEFPGLDVCVVDSGSNDPVVSSIVERLSEQASNALRVKRLAAMSGSGALANVALRGLDCDYVLMLEAGDAPVPGFVSEAVEALERHQEYSAVVSHAEVVMGESGEGLRTCSLSMGEARMLGLQINRYSGSGFVMRAVDVQRVGVDDELGADVWWDFHMRAVSAGLRYIASPSVDLRKRRLVPVAGERSEVIESNISRHNVLRNKHSDIMGMPMPLYVLEAAQALHRSDASGSLSALEVEELERYRNSETIKVALSLVRFVHQRAPGLLVLGKRCLRSAVQRYRRVRGAA